jgi:hypothetical protein
MANATAAVRVVAKEIERYFLLEMPLRMLILIASPYTRGLKDHRS